MADDLVGAKERAHAGPQRRAIRHILTVDQKGALIHLLLRFQIDVRERFSSHGHLEAVTRPLAQETIHGMDEAALLWKWVGRFYFVKAAYPSVGCDDLDDLLARFDDANMTPRFQRFGRVLTLPSSLTGTPGAADTVC